MHMHADEKALTNELVILAKQINCLHRIVDC